MRCPVCKNTKKFKPLRPKLIRTNNFICLNCGLVFIPDRSVLLQKYYKEDGYFKKSLNLACRKQFISKNLLITEGKERVLNALKILPIDLKNKRILDIGCGYGEIIYTFKQIFGNKVLGIEASSETAKLGSQMFQVSIKQVLLEEFDSTEQFDLIWCSHILEHVNDPNLFIGKIRKMLNKRGFLYLEVPNVLNPSGGFDLNTFFYSEHLQTFSAYNLRLLLKKYNINVLAYSDENFLKFWCQKSTDKRTKNIKMKFISSNEILKFLIGYKNTYNIFDFIRVYYQKFKYSVKILNYKLLDLL